MILTLPLADASGGDAETLERWRRFLKHRDDLSSRMDLQTCNGCDYCGSRCTDGFLVTREEYEAARTFFATLPIEEAKRLSGEARTLPWPGAEETGATVTYCRYRDMERGRCVIYPVRPTICRLFGQTSWLPCPIGAIDYFPEDAATFWNDYRRFERHTWSEWDILMRNKSFENDNVSKEGIVSPQDE